MSTRTCSFLAVLAAAQVSAITTAGTAYAQDCLNWGDLDRALYCDESRDLVADTPSDEFRLQDPDTLVFAYAAAEGLPGDKDAFSDFLEYLSKTTGKKVRWLETKGSEDQIKAMRAGEAHLAGVSPGPTVYAVNLAGYVPIAVMCQADGSFGSKVQLITRKESGIESPADLKGKKVAQVSALSNSGALAGEGYEIVYSGSERSSITGVDQGMYDAAFVDSNVLARAKRGNVAGANDLRTVWESQLYPSTSFGFAHNLAPDLQRRVRDAFRSFDWSDTGLSRAFGAQAEKFCIISFKEDWDTIRLLQKEIGVIYDIKDL